MRESLYASKQSVFNIIPLLKSAIRSFCMILALCVSFIGVPQCYAADNAVNIDAPSNTSQIWVDIEGTNISPDKIGGTIDNKDIKFIASPSGVTSINALGGGYSPFSFTSGKEAR